MPDHRHSVLSIEQASVWYGPQHARTAALADVTLHFNPAELTLVMGPSGSGKTTLLSLLGCLLTPGQGTVTIEGRQTSNLNETERTSLRRRIGFIFQAFRLFHSLPAIENVLIAAEIAGTRKHKLEAARHLLDRLGLGSKLHLKPDELSGGEKQRVAIARALLSDPPIILADEPTASVDTRSGKQIIEVLRELAVEQKRTVVVVSHDQRWTEFAHRIALLEDGRVIDDRRNNQWQTQTTATPLARAAVQ